jgi:hypothetical protein
MGGEEALYGRAPTRNTREGDQETVEAWRKAQGRDRAAEAEGAKEKLLAKIGARSTK